MGPLCFGLLLAHLVDSGEYGFFHFYAFIFHRLHEAIDDLDVDAVLVGQRYIPHTRELEGRKGTRKVVRKNGCVEINVNVCIFAPPPWTFRIERFSSTHAP